MKYILLANLGNRNLYYRNSVGDFLTVVDYIKKENLKPYTLLNETFTTEEYDFRQFTKDIWEQMEAELFDSTLIEPRTLSTSDLQERDYECIYLAYTDQSASKFAYQDTIYEALILQRLFKEAHPKLPIEIVHVKGNPSDEKNLYQQYKPIVQSILSNHPTAQIVFHDVGGTTQMKLVAKTLFEYYLRQQKRLFAIRYKDHWSEDARESDRTLHSKYVLLDVAREFIEQYQFGAASTILARIAVTDSAVAQLDYHTRLADDRLNFRFRPSPADYANQVLISSPESENWSKKIVPVSFLSDLPHNERVVLFEFATICAFHFLRQNYTLGVATYYRLCEELCLAFVRSEKIYELRSKKENRDKFATEVYNQVKQLMTGSDRPHYGLPLLLAYSFSNATPARLKKVYETMLPTISNVNGTTNSGMNLLRNKCWLAHNNQAIEEKDINDEVSDFLRGRNVLSTLFKKMGMPVENKLVSMQKELLNELSLL